MSDAERVSVVPGPGDMPRVVPEFQPAAWVTVALASVDLVEGLRQFGDLLSDRRRWAIAAPQRESREAIAQIADAIRSLVPLHRLTAALIAPWLLETSATWSEVAPQVGPGQALLEAVIARLETIIAGRYAAPTPGDYHPWLGLAEWIWSQQTAWAVAAMQQELGREAVLTLSPEEYQARVGDFMGNRREPTLVRDRASFILLSFAQEFSKVIVHALDLPLLPTSQLRQLLALEPLRPGGDLLRRNAALPLTILQRAPLVQDDHLTVFGDDLSYAVRQALSLRAFQALPGTPWPTASLSIGTVTGAAQLRPPIPESLGDLSADQFDLWVEAMWRQRDELSDLDADMLDWLCAVYILQTRAGSTRAYADLHDFLKLRGHLQRHRGQGVRTGYETEARQQALRSLGHLQNLTITVTVGGEATGTPTDEPLGLASQAITISDRVGPIGPQGQIELSRFEFRPGAVFTAFLLGPGGQTALLSAMALRYDPYRQDWEKRLARLFSWSWRRAALDGNGQLHYPVSRLLDAAGKEVYARKPSRTRERLEIALDTLQQDGVISSWHYLDWDETAANRHGWAVLWLACAVRIVPPELVLRPHTPAATASLIDGIPLGDDDIGALIKAERTLRGNISQSRAAKELACSPGYINKLEGDKPNKPRPSEAFRQRVYAWAVTVRGARQGRSTPPRHPD